MHPNINETRKVRILFTLTALLCTYMVAAQHQSLRSIKLRVSSHTFSVDTLSIVPGSILCKGCGNATLQYNLHNHTFHISEIPSDSITLYYRVFAWRFDHKHALRTMNTYDSSLLYTDFYTPRIKERHEEILATPGIEKTGSLSRGISLGNNQNVFVNSGLNLQLEGMLNEDIRIMALISDQRIPFQPQGNTQQLRDFDRVLIQLDHKHGRLAAGDVVLQNGSTEFLRYYKNVQGGQATMYWLQKPRVHIASKMSAAIAKGKFASIGLVVREGVQGPYRLTPPGVNDALIIILANSEKVFVDGKLMKRGFNYDYIIDYNTGELTFTNTVLINRFTRVRVDFEYAERNYNRSIIQAAHEEKRGRFTYGAEFYREADNPRRPLSFELNDENERILRLAGDSASKAIIPSAVRYTGSATDGIFYIKKDTLINGQPDSIFVYAPKAEGVIYQVTFSRVGQGQGDYVQLRNLSNGRIYRYVGKNAGEYAPIRQIATPNARSMFVLHAGMALSSHATLATEWAYSHFDKNRYSPLDAADNNDQAFKASYQLSPMRVGSRLQLSAQSSYMLIGKNFNPIDRFRPIEFERDWNANAGDTLRAREHYAEGTAQLTKSHDFNLSTRLALRQKGINVNGYQHESALTKPLGPVTFIGRMYNMRNLRSSELAAWDRWSTEITSSKGQWRPGYEYSIDNNRVFARSTDSIIRTQMNYKAHRFFIKHSDTASTPYQIEYIVRSDFIPTEGRLASQFDTRQLNLKAGWQQSQRQQLLITLSYRQMQPNKSLLPSSKMEQHVLGRIDWQGRYLQNSITQELNYFTATAQELRREFQFIRINAIGEGTHQWIDLNGDGIPQLDEFVEALRPEDRQYIKVFLPTNDFINAYLNQLNWRLNINAPRQWQPSQSLGKFLSKFSNITSINATQRNTATDIWMRYKPLGYVAPDALLSRNLNMRNALFYNRANAASGAEYNYSQGWQTVLLTNGFQTRKQSEHRITLRKNLSQSINGQFTAWHSKRQLESDFLRNQNYLVSSYEATPEFSIQPSYTYRITLGSGMGMRNNLAGAERASLLRVFTEARINQANVRNINAAIRYIHFNYQATSTNTLVAYEMLEGLQPGANLTWSLYVTQRMAQGLQISIQYDGRKSANTRVVHLGQMQATVLF